MAKTAVSIAVLYSLFAAFSIIINIVTQILSIRIYTGPYAIEISILVGTAAGLPLRYFLEKRYIFAFKSKNIAHDGRLFVIYSFMGVITTTIFWVTEYAFHLIYNSEMMRYVGGVAGLIIGFYIKYRLDKKYVFIKGDNKALV